MKTIYSAACIGLDGCIVSVEVDIANGMPCCNIVGLPDTAVQEARERVRAALKNMDCRFVPQRITINLAPAHIKKQGALYDLPMALGIIAAQDQNLKIPANCLFAGELALDGSVRSIRGSIVIAKIAKQMGFQEFFLPAVNAKEARLISGITIFPVKHIQDIINHFRHKKYIEPFNEKIRIEKNFEATEINFDMIKGQGYAKRALTIAAAGGHNVLFVGPPGSGKTLLAKSITAILPPMEEDEIIEATQLYSIAGLLGKKQEVIMCRPFRKPHHTASPAAIIGGGSWPRPGEVSLAHRGVLFLDEFPEFQRSVLESLRQPLEDRQVTISRVQGSLEFPSQIILIAAQNPCPCGYKYDRERHCTCNNHELMQYEKRISGPLLDRIDMHIEVPRVAIRELLEKQKGNYGETQQAKKQVCNARILQKNRFHNTNILTNSEMTNKHIEEHVTLDSASKDILRQAATHYYLSARSVFRTIKVARTIADLENDEHIRKEHIQEALQYRQRKNES